MSGPGDPSRLTLAQRIDALCDGFEKEWKAGKRPRIEDYVSKATGQARSALLSALLRVELELLGNEGTVPEVNVYRLRFPHDPVLVTAAFNQAIRETRAPSATDTTSHQPQAAKQGSKTRKLGRFELQTILGQGAMGKVFKARDPQLDREVAIKVPLKETFRSDEERDRFFREARAAGSIQHPNICPIYDVGQEGTNHFIVMALIDGKPLSSILKERNTLMPSRQVALLIRKLALTLQAAHDKGVIHRDLKPGNIMMDRQRKDLIIMDFGLARCMSKEEARMTTEGVIMGTPAYMAPEQARGEAAALGPACDIYSLGVIFYEMLTGRLPFEGTAFAVMSQVINQTPPIPSSVKEGVDLELEKLCLKAMAKKPDDRFASMQAFADALGKYLQKKPVDVTSNAPVAAPVISGEATDTARMLEEIVARLDEMPEKSRRGRWLIVGGLLTVALAVVLAAFLMRGKETVNVQIGGLTLINDNSVTFYIDGKEFTREQLEARIALAVGEHKLELRRDGKVIEARPFVVGKGDRDRLIVPRAHVPDEEVGEIRTFAGLERSVEAVTFLPDDRHFVAADRIYYTSGSLWLWDSVALKPTRELRPEGADGYTRPYPRCLAALPDGKRVLSGWLDSRDGGCDLIVLHDLATGKELRTYLCLGKSTNHNMYSLNVSPDGQLVMATALPGIARIFEVETGKEIGNLESHGACFAPDGRSVASVNATKESVSIWDISKPPAYKRRGDELTGPKDAIVSLAFSPDGKTLAATTEKYDGVIYLWDVESRKPLRQLTHEKNTASLSLAFSPDGSRLLASYRKGGVIWWDVATGKKVKEFKHGADDLHMVSLSSDGRRALTASSDKTIRLWQLPK